MPRARRSGATCCATAMLVGRTWSHALSEASVIPRPPGDVDALPVRWADPELLDETFRTWGPQTVGNGADAIIFGPQFGSFHGAQRGADAGRPTQRPSARRRVLGCRTLVLFRPPPSTSTPNTFRQQAAFSRHTAGPLVEEVAVYIDNYPSTYDVSFPADAAPAIKFAKNSAFHYLNSRYLMAQLLLHTIRLLAPGAMSAGGTAACLDEQSMLLHDLAPISLRSRPEPASTALPRRYNTYCSPYCSRPYVLQPTTVHEGACGCDGGVAVWG